jgi:hypothetical protein
LFPIIVIEGKEAAPPKAKTFPPWVIAQYPFPLGLGAILATGEGRGLAPCNPVYPFVYVDPSNFAFPKSKTPPSLATR